MSGAGRSEAGSTGPGPALNFYGRRKGHKLRPGRQKLVDDLLPDLSKGLVGDQPVDLQGLFQKPKQRIWMEIGFGAGEHLAHQAGQYTDVGFIGVEPFVNGVATLLSVISEKKLQNIRLFPDDVRLLLPRLPDGGLDRLFILFSDPWPKKRHHRRRVFSDENMREFARVLSPGGELRFASDDMSYIHQALYLVQRTPKFMWSPKSAVDWRQRPADALETRYEAKARRQGRSSVYLNFLRAGD